HRGHRIRAGTGAPSRRGRAAGAHPVHVARRPAARRVRPRARARAGRAAVVSARSVSARDAAAAIAVLAAVAIGVLAVPWWRDERTRERPRLVAGLFVTLTSAPAWAPGAERWLV